MAYQPSETLPPLRSLARQHSRNSSTQSNEVIASPSSTVASSLPSQTRLQSSQSSVTSSPTYVDSPMEPIPANKQQYLHQQQQRVNAPILPRLCEAPEEKDQFSERDLSFEVIDRQDEWPIPTVRNFYDFHTPPEHVEYDMRDSFYAEREYTEEQDTRTRRRRSGFTAVEDLADRVASTLSRFPSLRRTRSRKRSSTVSSIDSLHASEPTSPHIGRSRSNSRARSIFRRSTEIHNDPSRDTPTPHHIGTIAEDDDYEMVAKARETHNPTLETLTEDQDQEAAARVRTPLLPPMMREDSHEPPVHSPLDSPAIAPSSQFHTPDDQRSLRQFNPHKRMPSGVISPPLSTKPSLSAFPPYRNSPTELVPTSEIPPMLISDPQDEWSDRLGHANFNIYPAPYTPERISAESCKQLHSDWEQARAEFFRHLNRTASHFGTSSKTFQLTEEKWASIETQWKQNHAKAVRAAIANGETLDQGIIMEPAPLSKCPDMADDRKWLKMGDSDDIVGAMSQAAPLQPAEDQPRKKESKIGNRIARIFSLSRHDR